MEDEIARHESLVASLKAKYAELADQVLLWDGESLNPEMAEGIAKLWADPGVQKCFFEGKRCIRATRQVLWPAWQHCWVVRFPSSTDDEGLWVQKNIGKPMFFIGLEATMAESETSSSILIVWLVWEHYFEKVVLWR